LAGGPRQAVEKLASQHQAIKGVLQGEFYSNKNAGGNVGPHVPSRWDSSDPVVRKFISPGGQNEESNRTPPRSFQPPANLLTADQKRGEEKFTTSLEPLPSMATLLWEEPAQCVVHAFDINVPEDLKVGYITAESEPVPDTLRMLGIHVDLLDAAALNFGDLS